MKRQFPAGERPMAFSRMQPVGYQIEKIVDEVGSRSGNAEGNECNERREKCGFFRKPVSRNQGDENEDIFHPLIRTDRPDEFRDRRLAVAEFPFDGNLRGNGPEHRA